VKGILETFFEHRTMKHKMDKLDENVKTLLTTGLTQVACKVTEQIKKVKNLEHPNFDRVLKQDVEEVLTEHTERIFDHCARTKS
jgi:intracellular sulfur oxidation DsrE/DsrF family protein